MKTPLRSLFSLAALALSLPLGAAEAPAAASPHDSPDHAPKPERHMTVRHFAERMIEREKAPFLGVETARITPALTAQLALPRNVGLVVREIVPDSPAAPVLQQHDILIKLDDQWLIESRQFAVLVRNHQVGDEVTLTFVRGGKQATAKVKLIEREVPKLAFGGGGPLDRFEHAEATPFPGGGTKRVLPLLSHEGRFGGLSEDGEGPGFRATALGTGTSNMVFDDDHGVLELTIRQGKKSLVARNKKGEQVFSGPIDTPAECAKMPEDVKARLEQIQKLDHFRFQPGPDFEESIRLARPEPIALPLPGEAHDTESGAL
jgi:hypothetical protein